MDEKVKIVILSQGTIYSDIIVQQILKKENNVKAIIISKAFLSGKSLLESIKAVIVISGFRFFLYKLFDLLFFSKCIKSNSVPVYKSKNINSPQMIKLLNKIKPDLIISCFFNQILKKDILCIPKRGCINIHPSYLPCYRGVGVTFWALVNNEKETGSTVHYIDAGIDSGDILAQNRVSITAQDTVHSLYIKCAQEGAKLIEKVLSELKVNNVIPKRQNEAEATYFAVPTKEGFVRFNSKSRKFFTTLELLKGFVFKLSKRFIDNESYYLN